MPACSFRPLTCIVPWLLQTQSTTRKTKGRKVNLIRENGGADDVTPVSSLATQSDSRRPTAAVAKFGLEDRDRSTRVLGSLMSMNPTTPSPGPKYDAPTNFGNQYLAAPGYSFGESRQNILSNEGGYQRRKANKQLPNSFQ